MYSSATNAKTAEPVDINKVHHINCLLGLQKLQPQTANLIIIDPPYFKIKGDFDFKLTFEEWQQLHRDLAKECKRVLAPNGTLFLYGHAKNIAYQQVIFDNSFKLENSLVWEKKDAQTRKNIKGYRSFAPVTERILMYSNYNQSAQDWKNGNANVYFEGFDPIRLYLREGIQKIGGATKAAEVVGVSSRMIGHYISKSQWLFPTQKAYEKLQSLAILEKQYDVLKKQYDVQRQAQEKAMRPFDNVLELTDVMRFSQESHITKDYDHPTQKPPKLTRALILTCSRKNDLVVIPFAGSGVECAMAAKEKRRFIGFDIEKKYVEMANKRCEPFLNCAQLSII